MTAKKETFDELSISASVENAAMDLKSIPKIKWERRYGTSAWFDVTLLLYGDLHFSGQQARDF